jgi:hypothetical protein
MNVIYWCCILFIMMISICQDLNRFIKNLFRIFRLILYYSLFTINLYYFICNMNISQLGLLILIMTAILIVSTEKTIESRQRKIILKSCELLHIIFLVILSFMNIINKNMYNKHVHKTKIDTINESYALLSANIYIIWIYITGTYMV